MGKFILVQLKIFIIGFLFMIILSGVVIVTVNSKKMLKKVIILYVKF